MPGLGFLETLVQRTPDTRSEGDTIGIQQTVIDDHVLERQQDCLRQDRQVWADQFLERLREGEDTVGGGFFAGGKEYRVLLQFTEDVELASNQMSPGVNDGKIVFGQVG